MNDITPNVPLLRKTLEHIEAHPQEWDQVRWRCESGMCFAGTAADLDGAQWLYGAGPMLRRREDDPADDRYAPDRLHVRTRAQHILGISEDQADDLFEATNTLDDLRRIVGELCGESA
jgi:hypothetical protein